MGTPQWRVRTLAAGMTAASLASVTLTTAGAGRLRPAYAAPVPLPPVAAGTLDARYEANRQQIARARRTAERTGDRRRAGALTRLGEPGRRFLEFDPRGDGRAVEVLGDLVRAPNIAVLVPGSDQDLTTFDGRGKRPYDSPGGGARAVRIQLSRLEPSRPGLPRPGLPRPGLALVAWLGYDSPATFSLTVARQERAVQAGRALRHLVTDIRRVNAGARVSLLCHSYGSVVCAKAARGLPAVQLVAYGSPGMGIRSAAEIGFGVQVWAGRGHRDWIGRVPHIRGFGIGHGADPTAPGFGAHVFDAGAAGHGEYLAPGSVALRNLTQIAVGGAVVPEVAGD